jgi:signal transduction histidine kinase/ligand-binding sensor domain-containing protein/DNA-binding response OmpR family regulator
MHIVTNTATALLYACRLLVWLFLCFISHSSAAQEYTPVDYLGIEQGLSNNAVTSIYQDRQGFMWFGTYDGLNRFDGYNFQVFRKKLNDSASLINNRIVTICEDQRNNIWIGTKKGISLYNSRTSGFSPVYFMDAQQHRLPLLAPINDIQADQAGNVFIGTAGRGLMIFLPGASAAVPVPCLFEKDTLRGYHVQAIRFDWQKQVWLFVQGIGLCRYDQASKTVLVINRRERSGNCLEADNTGRLWLGSENGLYEYNITANTFRVYTQWAGNLTSDKVADLYLDQQKNLWVATDGGGINILNTTTGAFRYLLPGQYKKSLTSIAIQAIFEDKESRKWIGTLRGGINIIDPQKNKFTTIVRDASGGNSLINNFVLSFCEEQDGNIWIGTDGGGLSYWNRSKDHYTNFEHLPTRPGSLSSNFVTSIVQDYRQNTWIATYGGNINRFNRATNSFKQYYCSNPAFTYADRDVWTLYEDADKNLWAGTCTGGSLYRLNQQKDQFELFDEKLNDVITMAEDRQGNLWAGTFQALIRIDKKNKQHRHFPTGSAVRAIYEDKAGNCWVGTEGGGLLLFDRKKETFSRITEAEGLANNAVLNILEDRRGNLWMSTFNGLSRLDSTRKHFRNFYESDGLQSNQFNYNAALISKKGEFIFGSIKGFTLFYPDSITGTGKMPDLRLTGFKVDNVPLHQDSSLGQQRDLSALQEIELPYHKAMIAVDFVALEYSAPDKIAYAYYLEGWDKGWNYVGKWRTANYSRLQEGGYVLHIKSTNAEGIWNPHERLIRIRVLPPWYRTWWAWLLYIAMAVAAIYFYILYKSRQAKLKYEIKLAHIQAEQEKDLNEKKLSFFTNVAHEFRTPLTLIISPVKELLYSNDPVKDTTGDLNIVYRNARRLLGLVDQLLLFRKAGSETGKLSVVRMNFVEMCKEVFLCFTQQAQHKHIHYELDCRQENIELYADREKMEIALFNLISNALKYTPEAGRVVLTVWEEEEYVKVSVSDNGSGIPADAGDKIFEKFYQARSHDSSLKGGFGIGLNVVRNFVNSHQGNISYTSQKGQGTTFIIQLLKGKQHFGADQIVEETTAHSELLKELMEDTAPVIENDPVMDDPDPESELLVTDKPVMLIVDDDLPIREYVNRIFKDQFTVYEAGSGEDGLLMAQEYGPDIIISDVLMQGLSGIELCKQIRDNPSISHIPVILLTSSSSGDVKLKGIECGADDYITKPFDKELLVARVASILKSRNNLQKYFYNEITLRSNNLKIPAEYKAFLEKCISIVEKHLDDEDFSIKVLAAEIGMSHSTLYKKVKSVSGQSINGFIRFIRLRKAAGLFINTPCNVNEAAYQVGISDIRYFREQFNKLFGLNPSEYIKKYRKPFQKSFTVRKRKE